MGDAAQLVPQLLPQRRVVVITDSNVHRCHHALIDSYEHIIIGLGEQAKSFATVERLYRTLIEMGVDRNCFLLGIGGGIVTDITGYVASTYMRGLEFGFVSTTLLGQVDASVGGKNGINVGGYKNMVGTFSQPKFVVCDVKLLASLPDREFLSGLAEVIKAAIIGNAHLFEVLEQVDLESLGKNPTLLEQIVESALEVKIAVVSADERESGLRRVLNLGHTVAHAIEKSSTRYNHGEAVAIGLVCVTEASQRAGLISAEDAERIRALITAFGFELELPVAMSRLLKEMQKDKKRDGGSLHIILPKAIGAVCDKQMSFSEVESFFQRASNPTA